MNKLDVLCQTLGFAEAFSTLRALVMHLTILCRILINRFIIVLLITVDIIASSRLQDLIVESILTIALVFLNLRLVNFFWIISSLVNKVLVTLKLTGANIASASTIAQLHLHNLHFFFCFILAGHLVNL